MHGRAEGGGGGATVTHAQRTTKSSGDGTSNLRIPKLVTVCVGFLLQVLSELGSFGVFLSWYAKYIFQNRFAEAEMHVQFSYRKLSPLQREYSCVKQLTQACVFS